MKTTHFHKTLLSIVMLLTMTSVVSRAEVSPARALAFNAHAEGPSLVFLHGVYHGSWSFDTFKDFFVSRGYAAYVVDLRGHYGDQRVQPGDDIGFEDYLEDINHLLDNIPHQKVLIGHSLGGLLAMSTSKRPDIDGIVLISTPLPEVVAEKRWSLLFDHPIHSFKMLITRNAAAFYHDREWSRQFFFSTTTPEEVFSPAFAMIGQQNEPFKLFNDLNEMTFNTLKITVPALIFHGEFDPTVTLEAARRVARVAPGDIHTISEVGHDLMLEEKASETTARLTLHWLRQRGE